MYFAFKELLFKHFTHPYESLFRGSQRIILLKKRIQLLSTSQSSKYLVCKVTSFHLNNSDGEKILTFFFLLICSVKGYCHL